MDNPSSIRVRRPAATRFATFLATLVLVGAAVASGVAAQPAAPNGKPAAVKVPNFWNVERRIERPDAARLPKTLRFVTADDYPPFNFTGANDALSGFNVDLARAICDELGASCTIAAEPFDQIVGAVEQGRADAAIAGVAATPASRTVLDFSERYLGTPARFVGRSGAGPADATPEIVASKRVGVVGRTAHEAYLRSFFNEAAIRTYADLKGAQEALRKGEVDLVFGDGITLAIWLNGTDSGACCAFVGGPFTESRFFGDGFAVAVRAGNDGLRHAIDYALQRIWEKGVYTDLYLRWFPVSFY
ncbi:transporter substrate-binding domain-containing protein [Xanthobacter tagetidis]|uniref:ABC transporter substrate-binding protein n=1 Tax=Xanthobacter tagetidis TaxID=60216 RepID=A0A3L7AHL8_9HYPH|nr:transporter substrate-binding domain-containing protein [Xanthobacter tagetidis]MBB6306586.1 polar amino acid transport system substrate-binding protein [Xanthobacter tagetidis]RLP79168.1 ABC transporter substrate-binding protein [Xanthobacter tagetidis]